VGDFTQLREVALGSLNGNRTLGDDICQDILKKLKESQCQVLLPLIEADSLPLFTPGVGLVKEKQVKDGFGYGGHGGQVVPEGMSRHPIGLGLMENVFVFGDRIKV